MSNERAYTPSLVLHVLRNPHGWSVEAITAARLQAADELERLRKGLEDAAYALFQLKRMTPDGAPEFARMASDRAQEVLEGHAHEPEVSRCTCIPAVTHDDYCATKSEHASRDASPADLVGALQDVVHTDPGPVRAGKAFRAAPGGCTCMGCPVHGIPKYMNGGPLCAKCNHPVVCHSEAICQHHGCDCTEHTQRTGE